MRRLVLGTIFALVAGLATACQPPPTARFAVQDLGTLGGNVSWAQDINNNGVVVGWSTDGQNRTRAFRSDGAAMTDIGTLGGASASAAAVNDPGEIAGASLVPTPPGGTAREHAYLRAPTGPMRDLGTLGGTGETSRATDVNASGDVVGATSTAAGPQHAFRRGPSTSDVMVDLGALVATGTSAALGINDNFDVVGASEDSAGRNRAFLISGAFTGGRMVDLGTLGGPQSSATDVNDSGFVVGTATVSSGRRHAMGIVYGGAMVDLGTLGGLDSDAKAVNEENQVVGTSLIADGSARAFLHEGTNMVDLNTLIPSGSGWVLEEASGINDHGQIVGYGKHNGVTRAFLLSPSPEVSIGDASVTEGDSGTRSATLTLTLDHTTSRSVSVAYATRNGTATAPGDFTAANGTVTFAPFQRTRTVSVTVRGDTSVEPDEAFTVVLSNPAGLTVGDGDGRGLIVNDD